MIDLIFEKHMLDPINKKFYTALYEFAKERGDVSEIDSGFEFILDRLDRRYQEQGILPDHIKIISNLYDNLNASRRVREEDNYSSNFILKNDLSTDPAYLFLNSLLDPASKYDSSVTSDEISLLDHLVSPYLEKPSENNLDDDSDMTLDELQMLYELNKEHASQIVNGLIKSLDSRINEKNDLEVSAERYAYLSNLYTDFKENFEHENVIEFISRIPEDHWDEYLTLPCDSKKEFNF